MQPELLAEKMIRRTHIRSVEAASLEVIFFFVVPITLLYFHIIPVEYRLFMLLIFSMLIYGVIKKQGWTNEDVGLTMTNFKKYSFPYAIATLIALAVIIFFAKTFDVGHISKWWANSHFIFLFIVVSFFQEFAFRGFLMPLLKKIFPDSFTIITVNALLFAGMHAIFPFPYIGLPIAFLGGIFFAVLYHKYPNLILISICHSILNFAVCFFGLFMFPTVG